MMKVFANKYIAKNLLVFILFNITLSAFAQEVPKIKTSIDSNDILIGDQVKYNVNLEYQKDIQIAFPDLSDFFPAKIEVLSQTNIDTIINNNKINLSKEILLTTFDTGFYKIPKLKTYYKNNEIIDSISSESIILKVHSVKLDTTNTFKDIKAPIAAPVSFKEVLPFLLIGFGVIIIVLVIIYIIRKIKKKEPLIKKVIPKEAPYIVAIRELSKLKSEKLWQEGKTKLYHTKLTDIIRTYLFNRYNVKTYERTSNEILALLKLSNFDDENSYNLLKDIFFISDLVKFAKYKPEAIDNESCYNKSVKFIENTKAKIEEKEKQENKNLNDKNNNTNEINNKLKSTN
ncbi:MAG: hypothetical protein U9R54_08310 [Bacteroidota bacterium]|nr:hypothetical protein [Bacteroidota bacterium]